MMCGSFSLNKCINLTANKPEVPRDAPLEKALHQAHPNLPRHVQYYIGGVTVIGGGGVHCRGRTGFACFHKICILHFIIFAA